MVISIVMTTIVTRGVACWGSEKIAMVITYLKGFFQKWSSNFFLFTKARETSIIFLAAVIFAQLRKLFINSMNLCKNLKYCLVQPGQILSSDILSKLSKLLGSEKINQVILTPCPAY